MLRIEEKFERKKPAVVRYELVVSQVDDCEGMGYTTTYGIQAVDEQGGIIAGYGDVDVHREPVESLVERCNRLEADVLHLEDIVLDHIG